MSRREDIDNAIWSDPDFVELSADAKLLYLWSFTNPRCGMAGLYKVSKGPMIYETTVPVDRIDAAVEELESVCFLFFDGRVLWVRSRVKHLRTRTAQIAKSIVSDLRRVGEHPFVERFVETYGAWEWLADSLSEVHPTLGRGSSDPHLTLNGTSPEGRSTLKGKGKGKGKGVVNASSEITAVARDLFAYWQQTCDHPNAQPTRDRLAKVKARLREGYTADQVRKAIDGAARGAFVNDQGKRFDDLELICRTGSKLEDFIDRAGSSGGSVDEFVGRLGAKT